MATKVVLKNFAMMAIAGIGTIQVVPRLPELRAFPRIEGKAPLPILEHP
jgi:hypothetical protein